MHIGHRSTILEVADKFGESRSTTRASIRTLATFVAVHLTRQNTHLPKYVAGQQLARISLMFPGQFFVVFLLLKRLAESQGWGEFILFPWCSSWAAAGAGAFEGLGGSGSPGGVSNQEFIFG